MHLGNSIICPVTGIPMILAMGGAAFFAFKKAKSDFSKEKILPATALCALVFALQMINFSFNPLPSSGHIIGAVLLSALLGRYCAFLAIAMILVIQSLLFNDGGTMALGCNIFNMGFLACFVAYPLFCNKNKSSLNIILASILALLLGSAAVVVEGAISGSIKEVAAFLVLMTSSHLLIGIAEGVFSALVYRVSKNLSKVFSYSTLSIAFILAAIISNYASKKPDGLEWSLLNLPTGVIEQAQNLNILSGFISTLPDALANTAGFIIITLVSYLIFSALAKKEARAL